VNRRSLLLETFGGECRAAVFEEERLQDLAVWYPGREFLGPGDRLSGRLLRRDRALDLAFVDLGPAGQGVVPLAGLPPALTEGQLLALAVTRAAAPGKGPKLRFLSAATDAKPGLIEAVESQIDTLLAEGLDSVVTDSPEHAADLRAKGYPVTLRPLCLAETESRWLDEAVADCLATRVPLDEGASLIVEPGETLTAIDLNQGRAQDRDWARAAVPEICRQIRLRALAGRIVLDVPPGRAVEQKAFLSAFKDGLAQDRERARVIHVSPSGLVEVTRRRGRRQPLHELLLEPSGALPGPWRWRTEARVARALRTVARRQSAEPGSAPLLHCGPDLARAIEGSAALRAAEARLGRPIAIGPAASPVARA